MPSAPVEAPLDVKPEVVELETPKTDDDDAQIIDPQTFFEEFRRKQSELEQMVERFCSVTAIKSESFVSFQRPHIQPQQIAQPMATATQISDAKPPATERHVNFQHTPSVEVPHRIPSVAAPPAKFSSAKMRHSEVGFFSWIIMFNLG